MDDSEENEWGNPPPSKRVRYEPRGETRNFAPSSSGMSLREVGPQDPCLPSLGQYDPFEIGLAPVYPFGQALPPVHPPLNAHLNIKPQFPNPDVGLFRATAQNDPWRVSSDPGIPRATRTALDVPATVAGSDVSREVIQPGGGEPNIVCFGMITEIDGHCEGSHPAVDSGNMFPVQLNDSSTFTALNDMNVTGNIQSEHTDMIHGLLQEEALRLYCSCSTNWQASGGSKGRGRKAARPRCRISITIYGPFDLFDDVGSFFEGYDKFLQDPCSIHQDVKYCNPHRLSFMNLEECPYLSTVISQRNKEVHLRDIIEDVDFLDSYFASRIELEEAKQPDVVRTPLQIHQKQALTFMLRREEGWSFKAPSKDLWRILDNDQGRFFLNTINQVTYRDEPPSFRGGILADPMGLGKTLTILSLIATDDPNDAARRDYLDAEGGASDKQFVPATLIIVPVALLDNWKGEIDKHFYSGKFLHVRHHRNTKLQDISHLNGVNVVLTTFHTVSGEWKPNPSILFSVCWRRIVLDEAHIIRNEKSQMSQAICNLESVSRWAVTGTPIQNRLGDLTTLLKFIRPFPYHEKQRFEADISSVWKDNIVEGKERLQRLSSCLLLRRPKTTIQLPDRFDKECPVEFTQGEREAYEELRHRTIDDIDEAILLQSEVSRIGVYANVLQKIESLRLFCNLGLHYQTRHEKQTRASIISNADDWPEVAQRTFNACLGTGHVNSCFMCRAVLDPTALFLEEPESHPQNPLFSKCLKFACAECSTKSRGILKCGHIPPCPSTYISTHVQHLEDDSYDPSGSEILAEALPTKVKRLLLDLQTQPYQVKSIIFSAWRMTLDVVEVGLHNANIRFLRFDGKTSQNERRSVIDNFRKDPSVRVLLLTLSCGAVGLTLTEASRAYLMEPSWNPTLEEQALARIHRMGQDNPVTTIRFFVRDSFEENVRKLQQSKKDLARVFLSPHDKGESITIDQLRGLQSLL